MAFSLSLVINVSHSTNHPVRLSTYWFNSELHISFIFTFRLLKKMFIIDISKPFSWTTCYIFFFLPMIQCWFLFFGIFFLSFLYVVFNNISYSYPPTAFSSVHIKCFLLYPHTETFLLQGSNLLYVYFLWNPLSFIEAGLLIDQWWSSSRLG